MSEKPLRAYLMLRSSQGDWTVSVCRGLGEIEEVWNSRADPERAVGEWHGGFSRSPSHVYDAVAADQLGRMLLTASAKYALPSGFRSYKNPLGIVDGQPVFAGIGGW